MEKFEPTTEKYIYQSCLFMKPAKKLSLYETRRPEELSSFKKVVYEKPIKNQIAAKILLQYFGSPENPKKRPRILELRRRRTNFRDFQLTKTKLEDENSSKENTEKHPQNKPLRTRQPRVTGVSKKLPAFWNLQVNYENIFKRQFMGDSKNMPDREFEMLDLAK